jgi:hypothetical protein
VEPVIDPGVPEIIFMIRRAVRHTNPRPLTHSWLSPVVAAQDVQGEVGGRGAATDARPGEAA